MPPRFLCHPATRGLDLDAPETTSLRREIVRGKPFLRRVYQSWYREIAARIPQRRADARDGEELALELGSGAGFLAEHVPGLVTSDVFPVPGVAHVIDARALPFADGALRALLMTNVLHHVPQVERFLDEGQRCLRTGGRIVMVEPWVTPWSRFVYSTLHHEPFDPRRRGWDFPATGPLSGANGALPWILFRRDRDEFERRWPRLRVVETTPIMPLRYLLSGGVSLRALQPGWMYGAWRAAEGLASPLRRWTGMFALIVVERTAGARRSAAGPTAAS